MYDWNNNGIPDHMESNPYNTGVGWGGGMGWGGGPGGGMGGDSIVDALVSAAVGLLLPLALVFGGIGYGTKWIDDRYGTHYWEVVREIVPGQAADFIDKDKSDNAAAPTIYITPK